MYSEVIHQLNNIMKQKRGEEGTYQGRLYDEVQKDAEMKEVMQYSSQRKAQPKTSIWRLFWNTEARGHDMLSGKDVAILAAAATKVTPALM